MPGEGDPGGGPKETSNGAKKWVHKEVDLNVIIVEVIKGAKGVVNLTWDLMGEICDAIGVKIGVDTRGYTSQISSEKMEVAISLKPGVSSERFCGGEIKRLSQNLSIVNVSQEVKRVVTMRVIGLPFNAPDSIVEEYVEMFGGQVKGAPRMGVYTEGPWRGQWNGDRIFNVNMGDQKTPMGSFHLIKGCKVKIVYQGNVPTCGRCHGPPNKCPGRGVARECKEKGGPWVPLMVHMRKLWDFLDSPPKQDLKEKNHGEAPPRTPGDPNLPNSSQEGGPVQDQDVVAPAANQESPEVMPAVLASGSTVETDAQPATGTVPDSGVVPDAVGISPPPLGRRL